MVKAAIDNDTALITLLEPDGYYRYMGVTKPATATSAIDDEPKTKAGSKSLANTTTIDEDAIKKNYRKLSLRHHPDKGGDADIFRVVNRAYRVLMNPKLREQYDILGIDLDDDDDVDRHDTSNNSEDADGKESSSSQGIIQEIASTLLAGVIQLGVRTLMMGTVSVLLVRYRMTLYPSLAFLAFVIFRIFQRDVQVPGGSIYMTAPPTLIAIGMMIMNNSLSKNVTWNIQFWIGEALVLGMFLYNSLSFLNLQNRFINAGLIIAALLLSLAFRGNVWNYGVVIGFMVFFAILVALGFPMMELLLESILNEKLKRVGNKVRHHHQILNAYYEKTANR